MLLPSDEVWGIDAPYMSVALVVRVARVVEAERPCYPQSKAYEDFHTRLTKVAAAIRALKHSEGQTE